MHIYIKVRGPKDELHTERCHGAHYMWKDVGACLDLGVRIAEGIATGTNCACCPDLDGCLFSKALVLPEQRQSG